MAEFRSLSLLLCPFQIIQHIAVPLAEQFLCRQAQLLGCYGTVEFRLFKVRIEVAAQVGKGNIVAQVLTTYVTEDMRTMVYLKPAIYKDAAPEVWNAYFEKGSEGCVKGEHLDYELILPVACKFDEGKWKESRLEGVKEYLLKLL